MNIFRARATGRFRFLVMMCLSTVACTTPIQTNSRSPEQAPDPTPSNPIEVSAADSDATSEDPCSQMFSNLFVEVDSITYERYEVVRLHKTVHDKETGLSIPVSYAVLKSNGKPIATFEGVYFGLGNETDFGFAPLLGGETRQLIVSQTVPHGGRQWIVDLSADVRTVFDSNDWKVGDEDVCVHDFDGDGVVELSLAITTFWGFGSMSMMESPLPEVVFKYDPGVRKYLPDDLSFARGLQGIEDDVTKIDPAETVERGSGPYLAKRLDILLRYAYAGKTKEAWAFFESAYRLSDRQEIIAKIKTKLESEPVYKFIQSRRSTANR